MANVQNILTLFQDDLVVINMGLETFGENLRDGGVTVIQMKWRPPAGGDRSLIKILERLGV